MASSLSEGRIWASALARQALADLEAREQMGKQSRCYQLHFLQMATEKVIKAHLRATGNPAGSTFTHHVIRKYLPSLARSFGAGSRISGSKLNRLKLLAAEVEVLAPGIRAGGREDNAEYPWMGADDLVIAPIDFAFESITDKQIPELIKLIRTAAAEYVA